MCALLSISLELLGAAGGACEAARDAVGNGVSSGQAESSLFLGRLRFAHCGPRWPVTWRYISLNQLVYVALLLPHLTKTSRQSSGKKRRAEETWPSPGEEESVYPCSAAVAATTTSRKIFLERDSFVGSRRRNFQGEVSRGEASDDHFGEVLMSWAQQ